MLTIDEFQLAIREHQRYAIRQMIFPLPGLIVGISGMGLLSVPEINRYLSAHPNLRYGVIFALMAVLLLPLLFAAVRLARRERRDDRLSCPSCSHALVVGRRYVIASQSCGRCAGPILAAPEPSVSDSDGCVQTFSAAGFRSANKIQHRFEFVGIALCVVSYLAVVVTPGISRMASTILADQTIAVPSDSSPMDALVIVSFVICVATLLIMLCRYLFGPGRIWKCPHCRTKLLPHRRIVINTGNCFHCGRRVLADSN